ncbi:MAG: DUF5996 family protein [Ignavibacteriaceae bacterium]
MNDIGTKEKEMLPLLRLNEWKETKNTLHLFLQIMGKIRLSLYPRMNHWWHASLYVSPRGLTTGPIPYHYSSFEINLDLLTHQLIIKTGSDSKVFPIHEGLTVSEFYRKIFNNLKELGIKVDIKAVPYKCFSVEPFEEDHIHSSYNKEYIERFCRILIFINGVFEEFRGRFSGKSTPVHLFWHSFDLALTRFSGRKATMPEESNKVEKEAYSHEVISFGFWAGDDLIPEPAFYSYTFPEPEGLTYEPLEPTEAYWGSLHSSAYALMMYEKIRNSKSPAKAILNFLESTYLAGAGKAGWDIEKFKYNPL